MPKKATKKAKKPAKKKPAKKAVKKPAKKAAKKPAKKAVKKLAPAPKAPVEESLGEEVGTVTHYYSHISVAVIDITGKLKVGDKIRIKGHTSDFTQNVDSMQIEHDKIQEAKAGDAIGMKVKDHVREHDKVYKI